MSNLWWTKWHWDRCYSQYVGFPPSLFHENSTKRLKNVTLALGQAMKDQRGSRINYLHSFFNLGAKLGLVITPHPGRFTPGKRTPYPLYKRLGGPHGVWMGAENASLPINAPYSS